ncbi:MAG: MerR family transcriptional regulator [Rhodobacteraceae bacterium CG2_30_10_405]|nr:MerR family DNA-binding transcriptional regulator [Alphaproteobacteria bacterium]OIQ07367.1 MAG: MerR family transcriptional regulator [Rhodobacteraceae bacterium CG2_30_10_405]
MNQDMMTIAEMCAAYGVTPRTLRYYESRELLAPERRGGQRLFGKRDRARLTLILRGKRFGFALEDMRQLLDLYDHDGNSVEQIARSCKLARARLTEMEAQRAELDQAIAELKEQLTWGADMLAAQRRPAAE